MARSTVSQVGLTTLAAVGAAWLCCAGGTAAFAGEKHSDIATLTRLSNDWDKAIVQKDEAAIAGNMADDFRMIDGSGNVASKQVFVADIVDPKLVIDPYTVEEFDVRLYGDTALLSGRTHMTGKHDGQPFTSEYRYIDIYVRKAGTWKIISVQITRLPPQSPPK
jgi:ketosteroid isomerase-like protein